MKTILITGSTDGIGKATAFDFAEQGYKVIVHGRNQSRVINTVDEIKEKTNNHNIDYVIADFSDLSAVKKLSSELKNKLQHLDILINNAAVISTEYIETKDNIEMTFQVNHVAPFLLTYQLLPLLKKNTNSQIINIASIAHSESIDFDKILDKNYFDSYSAYEISKLANILFTYKLADDLLKDKICVNTLHPGVISTKLLHVLWAGGDNVQKAVEVINIVKSQAELNHVTGKYFINEIPSKSSKISYNKEVQNKMYEFTFNLLNT